MVRASSEQTLSVIIKLGVELVSVDNVDSFQRVREMFLEKP